MRIKCEVQVSNRQLPSINMNSQKRNCRSSLGLGRPLGSKAEVSNLFVHLCTVQNKQGTKYKVAGNILNVFTKFISEGKFTIRFKEPPHDLCVKADPVLAKSFLSTLKMGLQNKDIDKMHLSNLQPLKQSQIEKEKTKLNIESKREYPITTSFPYTLESLTVTHVELNRVENRIMKLRRLSDLDLSFNVIRELPEAMSGMQSLTVLKLSNNKLTSINPRVFTGTLAKTLRLLDLSHNEMEYLPHTILNLVGLSTLCLEKNKLLRLPVSLGKLKNLTSLLAGDNKLVDLPASLLHLKMERLDVSSNPLSSNCGIIDDRLTGKVPRLTEIGASTCIRKGLHPTAADIPATLVNYMQCYLRCLCGKICFESHILSRVRLNVRAISHSFCVSADTDCPALATLCSKKCHSKYSRGC